MMPLISVIIPVYNADPAHLRQAIESALGQSYRSLEVMVIDDGSTVEMDWLTSEYGNRITYLSQPNQGPSSARNLGIRSSRGDCIAFLDADDVWERGKTTAQVAVLESQPRAGLVYARVSRITRDGQPCGGGGSRRPGFSGQIARELFMQNFIPTSTVIIRRRCLEDVGGFDGTDGLVLGQDYDLWLRIAERYEVAYVDRPLARYRVHPRGVSKHIERAYAGERRTVEQAIRRWGGATQQLRPLVRRRYARLFFEWGYEYFAQQRYPKALAKFAQALAFAPWSARLWAYAAAASLGPAGVATARWMKRAIRGVNRAEVRPRRVLHVLNTLDTGGAERLVLSLAGRVDRARMALSVCSLGHEGELAGAFRLRGVEVFAMRRRPGLDWLLCVRLARLIRRQGIRVVHTHNATPWLYGGIAARLAGARLVHTEHSNVFPHQQALRRAERALARITHVVIADSEKVARELVEAQRLPRRKVTVVVNGVDTAAFAEPADVPAVRRTLGLNGAVPVIGTVGRLVQVKDHDTLLSAFQR
ncbi:MAG: glycosyltransferase, partial [bacterium]